jgi:hypothetical protein
LTPATVSPRRGDDKQARFEALHRRALRRLDSRTQPALALPAPEHLGVRTLAPNSNRTAAHAIIPASRKTADHAPVASRSTPLTAGDSTAPISPMRLFMPNAAP